MWTCASDIELIHAGKSGPARELGYGICQPSTANPAPYGPEHIWPLLQMVSGTVWMAVDPLAPLPVACAAGWAMGADSKDWGVDQSCWEHVGMDI